MGSVRVKTQKNLVDRQLVYTRLYLELKRFSYVENVDLIYALKMLIHKVREEEFDSDEKKLEAIAI